MNNMDDLRLEIETDDNPDNVIKNPGGDLGTWGWNREDHYWIDLFQRSNVWEMSDRNRHIIDTESNSIIWIKNLAAGEWLILTTNFNKDPSSNSPLPSPIETKVWSDTSPVQSGQYVRASLLGYTGTDSRNRIRIGHQFLNEKGGIASTHWTPWTALAFPGAVLRTTPSAAPATAVAVRMVVQGATTFDSDVTYVPLTAHNSKFVTWRDAELLVQDSNTFGTTFVEPVTYTNILTNATNISIKRAELEVGILTATVRDAAVDPAQAEGIRPGKSVRVRSLVDGTWETVYTGTLTNAKTSYDKVTGLAVVSLTAADAITNLATTPTNYTVDRLGLLNPILSTVGAPFMVNDGSEEDAFVYSSSQAPGNPTAAFGRYEQDNMTALEAVAMARDTRQAYAWVDRNNVINVYDDTYSVGADYAGSTANSKRFRPHGQRILLADDGIATKVVRTNYSTNPHVRVDGPAGTQWSVEPGSGATGVHRDPLEGYPDYGGYQVTSPSGFGDTNVTPIKVKAPRIYDDPGATGQNNWLVSAHITGSNNAHHRRVAIEYRPVGGTTTFSTPIQDWHTFLDAYGELDVRLWGFEFTAPAGDVDWWIVIYPDEEHPLAPASTVWWEIKSVTIQKNAPLGYDAWGVDIPLWDQTYDKFFFRDSLVEGAWAGNYFHGGSGTNFAWEGTPHFSRSVEYQTGFVSFSDIDAGFDTASLLNVINVKTVETVYVDEEVTVTNPDGTTNTFVASVPKDVEKAYQFYDRKSIDEWGARALQRTLIAPVVERYSLTNGVYDPSLDVYSYTVEGWAANVLRSTAEPTVRPSSMSFPVKDAVTREAASRAELLSPAFVTYKNLIHDQFEITGIEHKITPGKWIVTLSFDKKVDSALW